ncbi:MAG: porin family protein [Chitinophagaceae bacterium]
MSDHDFEKQVKLKMDEWKLRPSDGVWTEVEKRIRQRRRRRIVVLWLAALLLLTATSGTYYLWQHTEQQSAVAATAQTGSHNNTPVASAASGASAVPVKTDSVQLNATTRDNNSTLTTTTLVTENEHAVQKEQQSDNSDVVVEHNASSAGKQTVGKSQQGALSNNYLKTKKQATRSAKNKEQVVFGDIDNGTVKSKKGHKPAAQLGATPETTTTDVNETAVTEAATGADATAVTGSGREAHYTTPLTDWLPLTAGSIMADSIEMDANTAATPLKKNGQSFTRWRFGIKVDGGYSGARQGKLIGSNKAQMDNVLSTPQNGTSYNFALSTSRTALGPSEITKGVYYSAGFFAEYWLSPKFAVSSGLQYDYFSTRMSVGQYVDRSMLIQNNSVNQSVVRGYYVNTYAQEYTNKYKYIGIPVSLQWKVNKSERIPLILNGGFTISRLLSSNMLHYDDASKVYYEDKAQVRKTQVGLQAGFDVGILQHSSFPLRVGPMVRYNASGLVSTPGVTASDNRHLWSFGISLKTLLKR